MSAPRVVAVAAGSPAARSGIVVDDVVMSLNGESPRDVIQYQLLTDEAVLDIEIQRGGLGLELTVEKQAGEPLGIEVHSALFDQVRTCDNHCEFCFIYQLPPNLRESLYLKDDDYRLSFLYGNFTTLTRFTEADLERVVTEGLSPLNVSIHATDHEIRSEMLRNRRGGTSLRWLRALLDHDIEIHGQVVVCPGINDGVVLQDTLCTLYEQYGDLQSVCVVPLGVSRYHGEARLREHTVAEARAVVDAVHTWQDRFLRRSGRRVVQAADEYYLLADRPFPEPDAYEGFDMHEDGVGIVRTFQLEFHGKRVQATGPASGFFAWVDGAPADGYRAPRTVDAEGAVSVGLRPRPSAPVGILTGGYGAKVLTPLVAGLDRNDVRVIEVANGFFGGNISVAGLMVGEDLGRVLADEPVGHRYLIPDVCLSKGRFLDGTSPEDLPRPVEVVSTDGIALREALEAPRRAPTLTAAGAP
jgi:putative radical SAM enzyme (TIGR03279 family)